MEEYRKEIVSYELEVEKELIVSKIGVYPILFTSVHSMKQIKEDGSIKPGEPFTKSLVKYVANKTNTSYLIKTRDNGIDPNHSDSDVFKDELIKFIKNNKIELVIDIHGAKREREFDIELGTLNNLSADFSTINELKEAFMEKGLTNIVLDEPFKGGKITQYVYLNTNVSIIQIEINQKYRDYEYLEDNKKVADSLISFINQYISK